MASSKSGMTGLRSALVPRVYVPYDLLKMANAVVTLERFAAGRTFEEYLTYIATPANLGRESSQGDPRRDWSGFLRERYQKLRLGDAQVAALRWLAAQPGGPARILVIAEEWSSDCRRDVPMLARLAEAGGMELRIFNRDGRRFSRSARPSLAEAPDSNADLMAEFLNEKNGQTWQSIPVAAFYTKDLEHLYHYVEYPGMYRKDRLATYLRAPRPGETPEQTQKRGAQAFAAMINSPMFEVWGCGACDEIISMLYERLVVGSLASATGIP
jgi:thiol-disulfide isomerase/thioredoxin